MSDAFRTVVRSGYCPTLHKPTAAMDANGGSSSGPYADTLQSGTLAFRIPSNVPMGSVGTHRTDDKAAAHRTKFAAAEGHPATIFHPSEANFLDVHRLSAQPLLLYRRSVTHRKLANLRTLPMCLSYHRRASLPAYLLRLVLAKIEQATASHRQSICFDWWWQS